MPNFFMLMGYGGDRLDILVLYQSGCFSRRMSAGAQSPGIVLSGGGGGGGEKAIEKKPTTVEPK